MGSPVISRAKVYLDDNGNEIAAPQSKVYLDDNGNPIAPKQQPQRTTMDSVKDFAGNLWDQVNPWEGLKGMAQAVAHPIDTLQADGNARWQVKEKADQFRKQGEYGRAAGHYLYSAVPFLGPALSDAAGDFEEGRYAAGAGKSTGLGLNIAAPELIKNVKLPAPVARAADRVSEGLYQSALKPPKGANTTLESTRRLVQTGLREGIPISEAGAAKIGQLIDNLDATVQGKIAANPNAAVNKYAVARRLNDTVRDFTQQATPTADLETIARAGNDFLDTKPALIPAEDAQAIKSGTYKQLKGKYGQASSAQIEAEKALARGIKEELEAQFPEIKPINAREGQLIGLDKALEQAVKRINNRNIFGLRDTGAGATGALIGYLHQGPTEAAAAATTATILSKVISDPTVQSKIAIALNRASRGNLAVPSGASRVAAYANALGNAAEGQSDKQK